MSQINAAKRRGPMTRYFNRVREQKMSALRQNLIDSKDPEYVVGLAVQDVYESISHLISLRMSNDTADFVLRDWPDIEVAGSLLGNFVDDLRVASRQAAE
jgi:hypothetical protein